MASQNCIYSPSRRSIITVLAADDPDLSAYSRKPITEICEEEDDLLYIPIEQAVKHQEGSFISKPVATTEEDFYEKLEVLPPENWRNLPVSGQYFQMCEYIIGRVTTYYARFRGKYYTWADVAWKSPGEVMNLLIEVEKEDEQR